MYIPDWKVCKLRAQDFDKFTINYIGNIKTARPRSRLQDTNFPDWCTYVYYCSNQNNIHSVCVSTNQTLNLLFAI